MNVGPVAEPLLTIPTALDLAWPAASAIDGSTSVPAGNLAEHPASLPAAESPREIALDEASGATVGRDIPRLPPPGAREARPAATRVHPWRRPDAEAEDPRHAGRATKSDDVSPASDATSPELAAAAPPYDAGPFDAPSAQDIGSADLVTVNAMSHPSLRPPMVARSSGSPRSRPAADVARRDNNDTTGSGSTASGETARAAGKGEHQQAPPTPSSDGDHRPLRAGVPRRSTESASPPPARSPIEIAKPPGAPDAVRTTAPTPPRVFPSPGVRDRPQAAEISAVEVIIGRIEVNAAPASPPPRRRWSPTPMTLNDYLDRRAGRQGR
jgi:hypothetical protein